VKGLRELEEFSDRVPIAAGKARAEDLFDAAPGEFGTRLTVGKVDVELAADDMKFFGRDVHLQESLARRHSQLVLEENDGEFTGVDSLSLGEGIARDYLSHFWNGAEKNFRAKSALAADGSLNLASESAQIAFLGTEDYVATLQVRVNAGEFQASAECTEVVHPDFVMPADVDAAKHADENRHGTSIARRRSQCGCRRVRQRTTRMISACLYSKM